jgi:hypothetical protein
MSCLRLPSNHINLLTCEAHPDMPSLLIQYTEKHTRPFAFAVLYTRGDEITEGNLNCKEDDGAQKREEEVGDYGHGAAPGNLLPVDQRRMTFGLEGLDVDGAGAP